LSFFNSFKITSQLKGGIMLKCFSEKPILETFPLKVQFFSMVKVDFPFKEGGSTNGYWRKVRKGKED
jgi:hypothetical protein